MSAAATWGASSGLLAGAPAWLPFNPKKATADGGPIVRILAGLGLLVMLLAGFGYLVGEGLFGITQTAGTISEASRDPSEIKARQRRLSAARKVVGAPGEKQILFGDLHVHTTFSFDAFSISLPMNQGEGSHPPADACDFARFCSALDFWSINDHAESLTPHQWEETRNSVRQCNEVAGDPANPDMVTFLGWEWTQIGQTPADHYGHKNVILRDTAEDSVPTRPIASRKQLFPGEGNPYGMLMRLGLIAAGVGEKGRQPYHDFARFLQDRADTPQCEKGLGVRELPGDCAESAATPGQLFERLDEWNYPYLVIPHGNTWGFYTPPLVSWDKQLRDHTDPDSHEFLIEVFSGHGNTEQYRSWRALSPDGAGGLSCPQPSSRYTPECWQAGEIIRTRCLAGGQSTTECEQRAKEARNHHVALGGSIGYLTVPGSELEDWLSAGQCEDCYMPAYNYRPGGSVQYALALRDFEGETPKRFRFGIIASSDVHTARPGTGYKEIHRRLMTDSALGLLGPPAILRAAEPAPRSTPPEEVTDFGPYFERFASFFGAGGLVAAHSEGRNREAIWQALARKEVYGTSGDRILLWFDLVDEGEGGEGQAGRAIRWPMGSDVARTQEPHFEVRALGAFEQKPGCPADSLAGLGPERLQNLCRGECYHPADRRKRIDRIEIIRIRPQITPDEPVDELIDDPWQVHACPADSAGCRVSFSDPEFAANGRDTVYYVRAIEEASPTVNGGGLRCARDELGNCISINPCRADERTAYEDDCLESVEERAWSSPIFVDYRQ